jgi:transaldolase / glucose-6-phosphate isomerase
VSESVSVPASLEAATSARIEAWARERVAERLWARDGSLWAASGKDPEQLAQWLGWLDLPESMAERIGELERLAREVRADGYTRAAVLGMGGSSLAPELFSRLFGDRLGGPAAGSDGLELRILDSTHPDAVRGFREWAESARTLFCVSSKSGSTTEPNAFHAAMAAHAPALDFVAITDPGTVLADLARAQGFRAIVEGAPGVGGRYSALSVFGLLPAALHGVPLRPLLANAAAMAQRCQQSAAQNPGLQLGAFVAEAALAGRDKLTIVTTSRMASFGDWVEQLVAESTGKAGRGIVPVVGEQIGDPASYGADRCFVAVTLIGDDDADVAGLLAGVEQLGHPVLSIRLAEPADVGAEFMRWEVAVAAVGIALAIDPFDQSNVQESKDATTQLLDAYRRDGALPSPAPFVAEPGMAAYLDPAALGDAPVSVAGALRALLTSAAAGEYVALLAYVPSDRPETVAALQEMRSEIRTRLGVATTLGFGPRFLHSTGQLHKGGPDTGRFLQITAEPLRDLPIPGWEESFGTLIAAQALGDLASLQRRGRRVVRVHLADAASGLQTLETMIGETLATVPAA